MDIVENAVANMEWIGNFRNQLRPYCQTMKKAFIIFLTVFNICCVSFCISAFLFGTIYFHNMPTIQHSFPLHFHFNRYVHLTKFTNVGC